MKKILFSVLLTLVISISFTTKTQAATYCAGYLMGIISAGKTLTIPPFVTGEAENILYLNTQYLIGRDNGCWLEVQYRENEPNRRVYVNGVLLTKNINKNGWAAGTEVKTFWIITADIVETGKNYKKISDNVWRYTKHDIYLEAIPGYEIKCLNTGKILRNENDGWMISNNFQVTKLIK